MHEKKFAKYPPISKGYKCCKCHIEMDEGVLTLRGPKERVIFCQNRLCQLYMLVIIKPEVEFETIGFVHSGEITNGPSSL